MLPGVPHARGLGDVAIGVTALFVARLAQGAVATGGCSCPGSCSILDPGRRGRVGRRCGRSPIKRTWTSATQMVRLSELPLALIPAFAVPLFVILHLASLAQHRARGREVTEKV